jgi:hypothetical protein
MNWLLQCLWGHGERLRERDLTGRLVLTCPHCGDVLRPFDAEVLRGPAHVQAEVKGRCKAKAVPEVPKPWFIVKVG